MLKNFTVNAGDSNTLALILFSSGMLSAVIIAVMGIKLKWFRHRLSFDHSNSQNDSPILLRTTSTTEIRENCARGIYRQSSDADSLILSESCNTAIKTTKNTNFHQNIFKLPVKNKFNLVPSDPCNNKPSSTSQRATFTTHLSNIEQEVETIQENINMKRKINEPSYTKVSSSMLNLTTTSINLQEKSIDHHVENEKITKQSPTAREENDKLKTTKEQTVEKHVKFDTVVTIAEQEFSEKKFDQVVSTLPSPSVAAAFPRTEAPTPLRRKLSEDSFNVSKIEKVQEKLETEISLVGIAEEIKISDVPPPVKPRKKKNIRRNIEVSKLDSPELKTLGEVLKKAQEKLPPESAELRTTAKISELNSITQTVEYVDVVDCHISDGKGKYPDSPIEGFTIKENSIEKIQTEESMFAVTPKPKEIIQVKSILKSSETSGNAKTISFQKEVFTILDGNSDFSDEDDIWNKVDDHRYQISRILESQPINPPALPKTPPPSLEDEERESKWQFP